uniref:Reverse transcriptase domain-containing protein n=1 Tax=Trichobilharzia regenti TaxID=157069 RepID=A0AA85JRE1_TRIRE
PGVKKLNLLIKLEMKRLSVLYNQRFLSCKTPSNLWKLFKEITNGKRCISVPSLNVDTLNKSFIRSSVDTLPNDTNHIDNNFSGFNTLDVLKCLRSLKPSQSLGPDGIPAIVLRNCADILCYPLTNIFNASFSGNVLPFAWKNIKIIPIA